MCALLLQLMLIINAIKNEDVGRPPILRCFHLFYIFLFPICLPPQSIFFKFRLVW